MEQEKQLTLSSSRRVLHHCKLNKTLMTVDNNLSSHMPVIYFLLFKIFYVYFKHTKEFVSVTFQVCRLYQAVSYGNVANVGALVTPCLQDIAVTIQSSDTRGNSIPVSESFLCRGIFVPMLQLRVDFVYVFNLQYLYLTVKGYFLWYLIILTNIINAKVSALVCLCMCYLSRVNFWTDFYDLRYRDRMAPSMRL